MKLGLGNGNFYAKINIHLDVYNCVTAKNFKNTNCTAVVVCTYCAMHKYLHFVQADLLFAEITGFRFTLALCFQVPRKISFFHQHATLRMYTGKFDKLTATSMTL